LHLSFFVQHVPTHHDNLSLAANDEAMDASFALFLFLVQRVLVALSPFITTFSLKEPRCGFFACQDHPDGMAF